MFEPDGRRIDSIAVEKICVFAWRLFPTELYDIEFHGHNVTLVARHLRIAIGGMRLGMDADEMISGADAYGFKPPSGYRTANGLL